MCRYFFTNLEIKLRLGVGVALRKLFYVPQLLLVYLVCFSFTTTQAQHSSDFFISEGEHVTGLDQIFTSSVPLGTSTSPAKVYVKENTITANLKELYLSFTEEQARLYVVEGTKIKWPKAWQITYIRNSLNRATPVSRRVSERSRLASNTLESKSTQDHTKKTEVCVNQTPSSFPFPQRRQQTKLVNAAPSIVFQTQLKHKLKELFIESATALVNLPTSKTNTHSIYFTTATTGYLLPYNFYNRPPPSRV